jgi:hypothetical protein
MIINFILPGAMRVGPKVCPSASVSLVSAATNRETARRPSRLICRWVADAATTALHAVWHPETQAPKPRRLR